jgi:hypothetical protein
MKYEKYTSKEERGDTCRSGTINVHGIKNPVFLKSQTNDINSMDRKFHTVSIEDREMFAYNSAYQKQQAELQRVLSHPENRIRFCFEFLQGADEQMKKKCFDKIAEYSAQLDYSESHF